jgi:hypothetical protein
MFVTIRPILVFFFLAAAAMAVEEDVTVVLDVRQENRLLQLKEEEIFIAGKGSKGVYEQEWVT